MVVHRTGSGYPKKLQPSWKQLRTSENIYGTSKNIWYHPENNWGPIIDNLVQFEEDFNTQTEMLDGGWWVGGYLRPDKFLDHLTVIISDFGEIIKSDTIAS